MHLSPRPSDVADSLFYVSHMVCGGSVLVFVLLCKYQQKSYCVLSSIAITLR